MPRHRLINRKSKVTVTDVARLAEVSDSTVSRIMRGQGLVADATRDRVMQAVRALGYVPNRIAGSLASLDSRLVGVVIPSLTNIVFPEILQGISAGLAGTNRQSVISVTDYDLEREEEMVRNLLAWQPAALLIAGSTHTPATRQMLANSTTRVVQMMEIDHTPIDTAVGFSQHAAGLAAARHLIARGYRRFGYVGHGGTLDLRARARHQGLCDGLSQANLTFQAQVLSETITTVAMGRDQTAEILTKSPDLDVLVFSNDDVAMGGLFHCLANGIKVPQDLALFGFNGLDIGQTLPQPLSTIRTNRFDIGMRAVQAVLSSPTRPTQPQIIDTGFTVVQGATA